MKTTIRYRQETGEGYVWTSPGTFDMATMRDVVQGVLAGYIMGRERWAVDASTGTFIYGLDRKGMAVDGHGWRHDMRGTPKTTTLPCFACGGRGAPVCCVFDPRDKKDPREKKRGKAWRYEREAGDFCRWCGGG